MKVGTGALQGESDMTGPGLAQVPPLTGSFWGGEGWVALDRGLGSW